MNDFSKRMPVPARKPAMPPVYAIVDEDMKNFIKKHENKKYHFYKDTEGKVTIGYGQMIPTLEASKALPLYKFSGEDPLRLATEGEIEEAWKKLALINPGKNNNLASTYHPVKGSYDLPNLGLTEPDMEFLLESTLREMIRQADKELPNIYTAPKPARNAAADMVFNIGPTKFKRIYIDPETKENKGWPKFLDAFAEEDYVTAAKESHRLGIQKERNEAVQKELEAAARWQKNR